MKFVCKHFHFVLRYPESGGDGAPCTYGFFHFVDDRTGNIAADHIILGGIEEQVKTRLIAVAVDEQTLIITRGRVDIVGR